MSDTALELGRLERMDLRSIWTSEASSFTPWLAQDDNLAILGETIGVTLELEQQEREVGLFRADLLCRNVEEDSWVLIENQLERTDHGHLGQLLTYAAGLQAVTIVWIAARFTEEHRAALDWLNDVTSEQFRFFGLEIELWRIGGSAAAPRFNVVAKPNEWSRSVSRATGRINAEAMSATRAQQLRYWQAFAEGLRQRQHPIQMRRPHARNWHHFSLGRSGFVLGVSLNINENKIGSELFLGGDNADAHFRALAKDREMIDAAVGQPLEWQELPHREGCRIVAYRHDIDAMNEADWPQQHAWLADMLERMNRTFRQRIRLLSGEDFEDDGDTDDLLDEAV